MGIDNFAATFLRSEVQRGTSFGRLLTLGRQTIYMDGKQYQSCMAAIGGSTVYSEHADSLFRSLGASSIDVMDASGYEGANVIHDLNQPIGSNLHNRYDCVFDGGALEHVFNFPIALRNCMEMVKIGGCFMAVTPANNFCGHGFYQFSPELFYNALSPANGFLLERLLFVYRNRWYSVRNPLDLKTRVEIFTHEPTLLFLVARRREQKMIFQKWPQQSDYFQTWSEKQTSTESSHKAHSMKGLLLNCFPVLKGLQSRWRVFKRNRECSPNNRTRFTPIKMGVAGFREF